MNIGIDVTSALRHNRTGVEWYSFHVLRELKAVVGKEHHVTLYSIHRRAPELSPLPGNWNLAQCFWPFPIGWTGIRLAHELHIHPPDVFFTPGYRIPAHGKVPAVVTIHDVAFKEYPKAYQWPKVVEGIHRVNIHRASLIIVPSQSTAEGLKSFYNVPDTMLRVVPHGIDQFIYRPVPHNDIEVILKKLSIRPPYVLFVGRIEEKKGIIDALEIVSRLRQESREQYQLVLVGGKGYGYEIIEDWIGRNNATEWVRELGWIPSQDIVALINGAACYLTMSKAEGFALTILEALACGTPVVASDILVHREVGGEVVQYIDARDYDRAVRLIAEEIVKRDDDMRARRIARASQFPWRRTAEETLKVLIEAANTRK